MTEWVLIVWLVVSSGNGVELAPAIEIGEYRQPARCTQALDSLKVARQDVSFVAMCVERDK